MSTKTAWLPGLLLLGVCAAGGCNDRRGVRDAAVGDALFLPDAPSLLDAPFPDAEPFDAPRIDATTTPDAQASFDANMDTGPRSPTDAGPRPRPDATTDSPDSPGCGLSVTAMCSGGEMPLVYDGPCGTRAELHVMGQYQPDSDGAVDVTISRRGIPLILSFSSYAPTIWRVSIAPDAVVERVILHGYNAQMVTGKADPILSAAKIPRDSEEGTRPCVREGGGPAPRIARKPRKDAARQLPATQLNQDRIRLGSRVCHRARP